MRDNLIDIVNHTHKLGIFETIKVIGTDTTTVLESEDSARSVIMRAEFKAAAPDFIGTFGMPNVAQLATLLGLEEYRENATIKVIKKADGTPSGIHFNNKSSDFENDYRFMTSALVNEKLKTLEYNEPTYEVELVPNMVSIQRLRQQSLANSGELLFSVDTEDDNLIFNFGDHSSNSGKFVFDTGFSGLTQSWAYPISQVMGILALAGDITMKFSNAGALVITCDSGLIEYTYILPAQAK